MGRKRFDESYRREVVELSYRRDSIQSLSKELGISPDLIYRWRRELISKVPLQWASNEPISREELELENRRLKRAIQEIEEDKEILKKAIDIFSLRNRKSSN